MHKDVINPDYWRDRMYGAFASGERHRLMFNGSIEQFEEIEDRQKDALRVIKLRDSIIDVGCGYGRLLHLLRSPIPNPVHRKKWMGKYIGYDVSPDLVAVARKWWPDYTFVVADLSNNAAPSPMRADWAVALWVKSMLLGNGYGAEWDRIEAWMHANATRVLVIDE